MVKGHSMKRQLFLLLGLLVVTAGCGSGLDDDASLRATVEVQQLQDQLQALRGEQTR